MNIVTRITIANGSIVDSKSFAFESETKANQYIYDAFDDIDPLVKNHATISATESGNCGIDNKTRDTHNRIHSNNSK